MVDLLFRTCHFSQVSNIRSFFPILKYRRCGQHKCTVQDDFVYYFLQKSPTVVWPVEMPLFFLSIILPSTQSTHNSSSICLIPDLPSIDLFLRCSFSVKIKISLSCFKKKQNSLPASFGIFFLSVSLCLYQQQVQSYPSRIFICIYISVH